MSVANLANGVLSMKYQSALNTPASGSGAYGLEVRQSQGLALAVAQMRSQMIQRSRMSKKPRPGSRSVPASYETEMQVRNLLYPLQAVLGGTWAAAQTMTQSTLTSATISGTGVTVTFAAGDIITAGVRVGMMARLTGMTTSANNNVWFPILAISSNGRVITTASGILTDETADSTFSLEIAASLYTTTPYTDRYITVEEYLDIDRGKRGTDMRFNSFNFGVAPDQPITAGFGLMGRDLEMMLAAASPNFTSPTFYDGNSLYPVDGALYINSTLRTKFTGFTGGIQAPATTIPVAGTTLSPDVMLGQFDFAGNFSVPVEDADDFDLMDAETQISAFLMAQEQGTLGSQSFLSMYMGNLSYAGYNTPVGGDGAVIATIPLVGGEDERGTGYAPSTFVISTSAAIPS